MQKLEVGQKWRHKKRGTVYEIINVGARMQVASIEHSMRNMLERELFVVYRDVRGIGPWWVRMVDEFMDGRFELAVEETT